MEPHHPTMKSQYDEIREAVRLRGKEFPPSYMTIVDTTQWMDKEFPIPGGWGYTLIKYTVSNLDYYYPLEKENDDA